MGFFDFDRKLVLSALFSLVLITACKTPAKTRISKIDSLQLDTLVITPGTEKREYRASKKRVNDIIHTKLEVMLDWAKAYMYGKATITATPYYYPINSIELNARGMDINAIALLKGLDSTKLNYSYTDDLLNITLDKQYTRNDTFKIFIDYVAKPNKLKKKGGSDAIKDDKGLYFINPDGSDKNKPQQIWTQGETQASSVWVPCIDSPNEKMTNELFITVDKKYTTLSNGALVSQKDNIDGTRTDYWKMDLPHSTYLLMMAVGEFSVVKDKWRGKEVNYYVEKEFEKHARAIFGNTPEMIETFSNKLGVPYAWNKYSQIVVRDYVSGAMENTTATLHGEFMNQTDREMLDYDYEDVISHELFHHWFGDLVTCESWSNLPLNESFADYGEYIWRENKYGRTSADAHHHAAMDKYLKEARNKQVNMIRYYYKDREDMFDAHTYEKGGCILHMLRKYVGDEAFFEALKLYLETNKFNTAELSNLRLAFEKITGEDLNWFFNQWFFASGHPNLTIDHKYDNNAHKYKVTIEQKQDLKTTPLYKLPLEVDIYSAGNKERKHIVVEKQKQEFVFDLATNPDFVNVDAEKMLLCVKTETGLSLTALAFQYHNGPLYRDREDALFGLAKTIDSKEFKECIVSALADDYWELRLLALSGLDEIVKEQKDVLKEKLVSLARNDAKSLVRAEAISFLSKNYTDRDLINLYKESTKEQSYAIISEALTALDRLDSTQSVLIAKTLENEKNDQILISIMGIYARNGTDKNNDFFIKASDDFSGFSKITFVSMYGDFLKHCNDESINKALPTLLAIANDENKFVKFYGKNALKNLLTLYEEREKKLNKILKNKNTKETKETNSALLKVEEQKQRINELLKGLDKED